MRAVADLDVARTRKRRARMDQIGGIEHARAVLALIAARAVVAAMRAGADDIAVRQEALVGVGIDLLGLPDFEMAVLPQRARERLRQLVVGPVGRAAEIVPRQTESLADVLLDRMLLGAIGAHVLARFQRRQFRGRAVLVRRADVERLAPQHPVEARKDVGRQHRADQIAQMLDAVDVGQRAGDQYPCHEYVLCLARAVPGPEISPRARIRPNSARIRTGHGRETISAQSVRFQYPGQPDCRGPGAGAADRGLARVQVPARSSVRSGRAAGNRSPTRSRPGTRNSRRCSPIPRRTGSPLCWSRSP